MKLLICTQAVDKAHPILGFFHRWLEEFALHCEEIHVICLQKGDYNLPSHVHVHSLGKETGSGKFHQLVIFYSHFYRVFFRVRPDFVFFHMGAIYNILAAPFFMIRNFYNIKFYWWKAHGYINWFGRLASFCVDRIYTSTESSYPVVTKKRYVVGQAIDTVQFSVSDKKISQSQRKILFTGRIAPIKHLETFIAVAQKFPNDQFTIIGPFDDATYESVLTHLVKSTSNVYFTGPLPQSDLVSWYQTADIFLNTSLTHSMDKTVLEAILCGCIPITANRAFADMLLPWGLFVTESTLTGYQDVLKKIDPATLQSAMKSLQTVIQKQHGLDTFFARIFYD